LGRHTPRALAGIIQREGTNTCLVSLVLGLRAHTSLPLVLAPRAQQQHSASTSILR